MVMLTSQTSWREITEGPRHIHTCDVFQPKQLIVANGTRYCNFYFKLSMTIAARNSYQILIPAYALSTLCRAELNCYRNAKSCEALKIPISTDLRYMYSCGQWNPGKSLGGEPPNFVKCRYATCELQLHSNCVHVHVLKCTVWACKATTSTALWWLQRLCIQPWTRGSFNSFLDFINFSSYCTCMWICIRGLPEVCHTTSLVIKNTFIMTYLWSQSCSWSIRNDQIFFHFHWWSRSIVDIYNKSLCTIIFLKPWRLLFWCRRTRPVLCVIQ